jgi:putative DNA primase/helicase
MRIHSFGHLDEGVDEELPSYEVMIDFARNDNEVKLTIGKEQLQQAKMDLKDDDELFNNKEDITIDKEGQGNVIEENGEGKVFVDNQGTNKDIVGLPQNYKKEVNENIYGETLKVDKLGQYKSTIENIGLILENDKNLKEKIALNEFFT